MKNNKACDTETVGILVGMADTKESSLCPLCGDDCHAREIEEDKLDPVIERWVCDELRNFSDN